jgi:glycosyltransferase involved in cell wall biosynthesis
MPVAEAMVSGIPVAAAPAAAVREVLGGWGEIAVGWTAMHLADAIKSVLSWDSAYRDHQVAGARAHALSHYQWDRSAEAHVDVFRKVLATSPITNTD